MRHIQPFIPGEKRTVKVNVAGNRVRPTDVEDAKSPAGLCCSRIAFQELSEFGFGNCKFREATMQTDQKFWIDPHDGLVEALQPGEMNGDFPVEGALILRLARLARHLPKRIHRPRSCAM